MIVEAYDVDMQKFRIEGEELLARALQHEIDHLDGIVYVDKVEGDLLTNEELAKLAEEGE